MELLKEERALLKDFTAVVVPGGQVFLLQLVPDSLAFLRRHVRVFIYAVLELIHANAVGNEGQRLRSMELLILVRLIAKEALHPGIGKKLHAHGMDFRSLRGGETVFRHGLHLVCGIRLKSVPCLMGQHIHVRAGAIEVAENERRVVIGKEGAVAACRLAGLCLKIHQLMRAHKAEELPGFL